MWSETDKKSLRPVAFAAVVFSTVAITACLITFPLVFQYVQTLQATIQGEVEFCRSRSRDMWNEMMTVDFDESADPTFGFFRRITRSPGSPGPDAELHDKILPVPPQCPCQAPTGAPAPGRMGLMDSMEPPDRRDKTGNVGRRASRAF
ncbi:Col-cuticle-N domain-containing protein [Aphelenchoides fujianensis]|nr:Col-cuticle-N domain-containing protein [Aphelenchoides fujianensis]